MRHGSLFSGIGGFDLAAQWMGWENVFQVEKSHKCRLRLKEKFNDSKQYAAIEDFTGNEYTGRIDVLSGGFPCQTFSLVGKGAVDLTLWKEMLRIIRTIRPRWVVGENVLGILARKTGMALETVCVDLEATGYTVLPPLIIPACATGAPHRRDRVWITAYTNEIDGNISGLCSTEIPQFKEACLSQDFSTDTLRLENEWNHKGGFHKEFTGGSLNGNWLEVAAKLCRMDDGLSKGLDKTFRLESLGNAIVPQVAYEIFKAIESHGLPVGRRKRKRSVSKLQSV